eukprot:CAMPEP_0201546152 /NCGR_PEP_ID=MMETSP0173_2-20130828/2531_1 /ASSEMBLY_ACC=CAM_ASM_000268 /TAXON_ID=218659 /ORGANISM="Vexillifera sp., Strain DIVA3 564/2" /LENGTH=385 /DNA_ID=CAMNT_0047954755 /DNA_START=130 /DNA_END=1287 /DNA_ORIENTATION=+
MSPEILKRQRTLEQFLLNFEMKRLRGTSWRYFDLATTLEEAVTKNAAAAAEKLANSSGEAKKTDDGGEQKGDVNAPLKRAKTGSSTNVVTSGNLSNEVKRSKEVIFVLPSGGLRPEAQIEHIICFARRGFRVIAPLLPDTLIDFEDYAAGLLLIMRHEKVGRAHFYGLAMGAMVIHFLMYKYPERVLTATLAHCAPPDDEFAPKCEKAIKRHEYSMDWLTHYLLGYKITSRDLDLAIPDIEGDEKNLWLVFMKRFQISKSTADAYTRALAAYHKHIQYIPEDFRKFKGGIFLIDADYTSSPEYAAMFEEMKALHPKAHIKMYEGNRAPLFTLVRGHKSAKLISKFISEWRAKKRAAVNSNAAASSSSSSSSKKREKSDSKKKSNK